MTDVRVVDVEVSPLWRSPHAPRPIDGPAVLDQPEHAAWLAALDAAANPADGRLGLDDRLDSEATRGEPVVVHDESDGWSRVTLPWQPSGRDPHGYPGYLRTAHLAPSDGWDRPAPETAPSADAALALARRHLGLPYLWGGVSDGALDCSGLVHLVLRRLGVVVPRDADDQAAAAMTVPPGQERAGDLYFFAHPGRRVHHVGFVVSPGVMLHAPQTGAHVVQEPLDDARSATLVTTGRFRLA